MDEQSKEDFAKLAEYISMGHASASRNALNRITKNVVDLLNERSGRKQEYSLRKVGKAMVLIAELGKDGEAL